MDTPSAYPDVMMMPMGLDASMQGFDMPKIPPEWTSVTTVMMRNIPNRYTQLMLLEEISSAGFAGTYDFLYLPIDPETNANKGYVFINFVDSESAWRFKGVYEGTQMKCFNSSKFVSVSPATLQGLEANYAHYSTARCSRGHLSARPLFFREPQQKFLPRNGRRSGNRRSANNRSLLDVATARNELPQTSGEQTDLRMQQSQQPAFTSQPTKEHTNHFKRFC